MRWFFSAISLGLLVAAVSGADLLWDGNWELFRILDYQVAIVDRYRLFEGILNWMTLMGSHLSNDPLIWRTIFGITHTVVTLIGLGLSWWITQKWGRTLFVWPAISIALVSLAGQICSTCQGLQSIPLFWPILLATLFGMPAGAVWFVLPLALMVGLYHPIAVGVFAVAAAASFLVGALNKSNRRKMWLWGGLWVMAAALFAIQLFSTMGPYEREALTWEVVQLHYFTAVAGPVAAALLFAFLASILIFAAPLLENRVPSAARIAHLGSLLMVGFSGLILLYWARNPWLWANLLNFRTFVLPVSLLPFLLAVLESLNRSRSVAVMEGMDSGFSAAAPNPSPYESDIPEGRKLELGIYNRLWIQFASFLLPPRLCSKRLRVIQLAGLVFLLVLSLQSLMWFRQSQRLLGEIESSASACISASSVSWLGGTPLDNWTLATYSLLIQGRSPKRIVMPGNGCSASDFADGIPLPYGFRRWDSGWFDLKQLELQLRPQAFVRDSYQSPVPPRAAR